VHLIPDTGAQSPPSVFTHFIDPLTYDLPTGNVVQKPKDFETNKTRLMFAANIR